MEKVSIQDKSLFMFQTEFNEAAASLVQQPFDAKLKSMPMAVGFKSAMVLAIYLNKCDKTNEIADIFELSCREAGEEFRPCFDYEKPLSDKEVEFGKAKNAVGGIALKNLPDLLKHLDVQVDIHDLIKKTDIVDVAQNLRDEFDWVEIPKDLTGESIVSSLQKTVPMDDYYRKTVDTLKADHSPLSADENTTLTIMESLAQVMYLNNQVFVASYTGEHFRINSSQRVQFNPFPLVKKGIYKKTLERTDIQATQFDAFCAVAFEVYKDVIQYKDALASLGR